MIHFYNLSGNIQLFVTFLVGLAVISQTFMFMLNRYRYRFNRLRVFENALEIFVLVELIILAILLSQVVNGYQNGFIIDSGYKYLRIIMFIIV